MKRKLTLLLTCLLAGISLAIAQTSRKVMGVVFSEEDNQPVIGASVLVKGTSIGTTTDLDGKFVINNVPSSSRTWSFPSRVPLFSIFFLHLSFLFTSLQEQCFIVMKLNIYTNMMTIINCIAYIRRIS